MARGILFLSQQECLHRTQSFRTSTRHDERYIGQSRVIIAILEAVHSKAIARRVFDHLMLSARQSEAALLVCKTMIKDKIVSAMLDLIECSRSNLQIIVENK